MVNPQMQAKRDVRKMSYFYASREQWRSLRLGGTDGGVSFHVCSTLEAAASGWKYE
jgi:hypothetical protein